MVENNSPRYDWGPKKAENYGLEYAGLHEESPNGRAAYRPPRTRKPNTYHNSAYADDYVSAPPPPKFVQERL